MGIFGPAVGFDPSTTEEPDNANMTISMSTSFPPRLFQVVKDAPNNEVVFVFELKGGERMSSIYVSADCKAIVVVVSTDPVYLGNLANYLGGPYTLMEATEPSFADGREMTYTVQIDNEQTLRNEKPTVVKVLATGDHVAALLVTAKYVDVAASVVQGDIE